LTTNQSPTFACMFSSLRLRVADQLTSVSERWIPGCEHGVKCPRHTDGQRGRILDGRNFTSVHGCPTPHSMIVPAPGQPTQELRRELSADARNRLGAVLALDRSRDGRGHQQCLGCREVPVHGLSGDSDIATVRIHRMSGRTPMNGSPAAHVSGVYGISLSRLGLVCGAIALLAARLGPRVWLFRR